MPFSRCHVTKAYEQRVDRASPSQWFSESLRSGALGFPEYPWRKSHQRKKFTRRDVDRNIVQNLYLKRGPAP